MVNHQELSFWCKRGYKCRPLLLLFSLSLSFKIPSCSFCCFSLYHPLFLSLHELKISSFFTCIIVYMYNCKVSIFIGCVTVFLWSRVSWAQKEKKEQEEGVWTQQPKFNKKFPLSEKSLNGEQTTKSSTESEMGIFLLLLLVESLSLSLSSVFQSWAFLVLSD